MKTSNFANNARYNLQGISISRYPDRRTFSGPEFPPLMPSKDLLRSYKDGAIGWHEYENQYIDQLKCLDAQQVYEALRRISKEIGASEVVILCFESAKTLDSNPCHRRLVARWFGRTLGLDVPEWDKAVHHYSPGPAAELTGIEHGDTRVEQSCINTYWIQCSSVGE